MNARSISLRSQYELKERFGMKTAFDLRRRSWTFSLNTSWNFESTIASSTIPRTVRPSLSRTAWKYRAYGVARPFSQTTKVGNPSSTAPSHTSRAECEPIVAIRMADGSYPSRTFRIASRPTIVPVPSRCGPMVRPSLILCAHAARDHGGTSLSADSFRATLDARSVRRRGWRVGDDGSGVLRVRTRELHPHGIRDPETLAMGSPWRSPPPGRAPQTCRSDGRLLSVRLCRRHEQTHQ